MSRILQLASFKTRDCVLDWVKSTKFKVNSLKEN